MSDKPEVTVQPVLPVSEKPAFTVDAYMEEFFTAMGYTKPFPRSLIMIYRSMKLRKDRLHPGRLSPECFALIATMADMFEGEFNSARG